MTDQTYQVISMIAYFLLMIAIGLWAYRKNNSVDDYMLGGRQLNPLVAALSAGASDMSGWLLMGLPGALYVSGLIEFWIAIGLTVGAWLNWMFVAPRLRSYTEVSNNSITVPSFLDSRLRDKSHALRVVSGIIILGFFTFYVSSGMVAGGKFFDGAFGFDYLTGMIIIAIITIFYTLAGGFLAVSYTDMIQGLIMLLALVLVPLVGILEVGGIGGMVDSIKAVEPDLLSFFKGGTAIGIISAVAWGLGYFGQPHIIVRFMAMRTPADAPQARRIGIGWMALSVLGALGTALVGVAYAQQNPEFTITDPEQIFILMGQILFHPLIAGIMLAAILAAIMSTISSQLLVSSSALVEDIYAVFTNKQLNHKTGLLISRLSVATIAVIAALLALNPDSSVLELVAFAWAGFGASFGPIILLSLFWRKLTKTGALAGMVVGAVIVAVWGNIDGGIFDLYEIVPGFVFNLIVAIVVSLVTFEHNEVIDAEFDAAALLAKDWSKRETAEAHVAEVSSRASDGYTYRSATFVEEDGTISTVLH